MKRSTLADRRSENRVPKLYLVTDRHRTAGRPLLGLIEQALQGGVDAVQLREKDLPARELVELGRALRDLCRRHQSRLFINDRIDIALILGADGVQLPAHSFSVGDARALLGSSAIIGVSTHSLSEAESAANAGADYLVFGPIYETPSKRAYGAPQGVAMLSRVVSAVAIPVLAIGGITPRTVDDVRQHGASGVAVIGAILEADDVRAASQALRGPN